MRVHKYPLKMADEFSLPLPRGAVCLSVQMQGEFPCLWALVDPDAPVAARWFRLAGTGHDVDATTTGNYVGTFQMRGGALVFHLFEATR